MSGPDVSRCRVAEARARACSDESHFVNMGFFPSALAVSLLLPSDCAASQLVSTWTFRSLASGGPVLYNWEGFGFGFYSFF